MVLFAAQDAAKVKKLGEFEFGGRQGPRRPSLSAAPTLFGASWRGRFEQVLDNVYLVTLVGGAIASLSAGWTSRGPMVAIALKVTFPMVASSLVNV